MALKSINMAHPGHPWALIFWNGFSSVKTWEANETLKKGRVGWTALTHFIGQQSEGVDVTCGSGYRILIFAMVDE
jgi:hypothetical protein